MEHTANHRPPSGVLLPITDVAQKRLHFIATPAIAARARAVANVDV